MRYIFNEIAVELPIFLNSDTLTDRVAHAFEANFIVYGKTINRVLAKILKMYEIISRDCCGIMR